MNTTPPPLSRREFVRAAALLGVAGAVPLIPSLSVARAAHSAGSDTLKVGLIGCGGRGTGAAVQAVTADPGAVLWAVGDTFEDRIDRCLAALNQELAEDAGERVQVPPERRFVGFDAYEKVIAECDVVCLTSPSHFRPAHLAAAVAAGRHVFCEKPMAVDAPGVRSVLESARIAREKNLALVSGFCWRYSDPERATLARIHEGAIGDVRCVHATYHTNTLTRHPRKPEWSDMEWQLRNWWHFTWLSGDHIVEQACHSVDKIAWAMGDRPPARVVCLGGRQAREGAESGNVYDHFAAIYEYESGARAFLTCRQIDGTPSDNSDWLVGSRGSCEYNGWRPIHTIKDPDGRETWRYSGQTRNMYQTEHDELFASIRSGKPINDGVWMAHSTLMAIMARMGAYTGQTVTWDMAMNSQEDLTPAAYQWGPVEIPPVAVPGKTKFA